MFARSGKRGPGLLVALVVVALAFGAGIGVGWGTGLIGSQLATPAVSPSPSPSPSRTAAPDVSIPPLPPIDRELDDADREAGLVTLAVPVEGAGTFTVASSHGEPTAEAASVRWVRVEYEDGLTMDGSALSDFIIDALNDPRGWGARGRFEFVPTEGAPDLRIVVASPTTTAATCLDPHAAATVGAAEDDGEDASAPAETSASPSPSGPTEDVTCADRGLMVISAYDWAAGLAAFGDDRTSSRIFQINHGAGHLLGEDEATCASGRAIVMVDQSELPDDCDPNPWPWPDEPLPEPSPTPSASTASALFREHASR